MKPTAPSDRVVVNIKDPKVFKSFIVDGQPLPKQGFVQLDETFPAAAGFHIYRMEPGAVTQPHEHTCHEQFLVLDGEMIENDGTVFKAGDFVLLKQGTQHNSRTETGCTLAVFVRTPERNL
ncbi:MAG: cupin domain-containing protein [Hyphomicrobiaceae bacterium]